MHTVYRAYYDIVHTVAPVKNFFVQNRNIQRYALYIATVVAWSFQWGGETVVHGILIFTL
jgi:hypothetical protein